MEPRLFSDPVFLGRLLNTLHAETQPIFGKLSAQGMIEHLVESVEYTNGKKRTELENDPAEAARQKQAFIYTDMPMPKGLVTPGRDDTDAPFRFSTLSAAIEALHGEIAVFEHYYASNPDAQEMHPGMGAFSYGEWIIFHGKHFTYHFQQFGLL